MALRLRIVQPIIPRYREPVFAALAARSEVNLEVWADLGRRLGSLEGLAGSERFRCVQATYLERGPFVMQRGVWSAVDRRGADAVILPWASREVHLVPALLRGRANGVRVILWGHGIGKTESRSRRWFGDRILRLADRCVVYGPSVAARLVRSGYPAERVHVAPNSTDLSRAQAARLHWPDHLVDAFLAERGLARHRYALFVARMEPWKRPRLLLEAVAARRAAGDDLRCVFIGDGAERSTLEALARERGLADAVRFEGPIYDEERLAPFMLGAACLAIPAAIGLSLLHAFGYALPVVTSEDRLPHGPEIDALRPGDNGFLVRDNDVPALADAIGSLAGDPPTRARMGALALATVERRGGWNIDSMADAFVRAALGQPAIAWQES